MKEFLPDNRAVFHHLRLDHLGEHPDLKLALKMEGDPLTAQRRLDWAGEKTKLTSLLVPLSLEQNHSKSFISSWIFCCIMLIL